MSDVTSKYRLHGARRDGPKRSPVLVIAVVSVAAAIVIVTLVSRRQDHGAPSAATPPSPTPRVAGPPSPAPTATSTPTVGKQESGWVDVEVVRPPTRTPTMPPLPEVPTRAPRSTPTVPQCAELSWSTVQVFTPSAQVKVDIRVRNRCPYELGPGNLMIEITGWRDGDFIQSVRGTALEAIRPGVTGDVSIGLPGSEDWYDRIEVVVVD
jgi:hypothetical protein